MNHTLVELQKELESLRIRRLAITTILKQEPDNPRAAELRQSLLLLTTAMDFVTSVLAAYPEAEVAAPTAFPN